MRKFLIPFGIAAVIGFGACAKEKVVIVRGTPIKVDEQSVKCDADIVPTFSTLRLADCASSKLITLPKSGSKILQFTISPGDPSISEGQRAELRDRFEAKNGEEVWYRFKTLLPLDYPFDPNNRVVTAQWHERMPEGAAFRRPPLAHRIVDHGFLVTLWNDPIFEATSGKGDGILLAQQPKIEAGTTSEYVYRIVWRPDEHGLVTGWRREGGCQVFTSNCKFGNWTQFVSRAGPVGFKDAAGYYFKFGVYTTHKFATPLIIYHSDYERGATAASIGATEPIFTKREAATVEASEPNKAAAGSTNLPTALPKSD